MQNETFTIAVPASSKPVIPDTEYAEYTLTEMPDKPEETGDPEEAEETEEKEALEQKEQAKEPEADEEWGDEEEDEYYYEEYDDYDYSTQSVFWDGFDSSFKAYMDYRCITDTSSVQYRMQQEAYTDSRGFRRIGDDYCVALGTGFTSGCGERFVIYLDSGYCFNAIVSDVKSDYHTDATNCYVPRGENSGNVVEFIIDTDYADWSMLSSGNAGYYDDLSGNITAVVPV